MRVKDYFQAILIAIIASFLLFSIVNEVLDNILNEKAEKIIAESFKKESYSEVKKVLNCKELKQILIYQNVGNKTWWQAEKAGFLLPVLNKVAIGLNDLKQILQKKEDIVEEKILIKLETDLTKLINTNAYKWRRYLNGLIQFTTIIMALMAILIVYKLRKKLSQEIKFIIKNSQNESPYKLFPDIKENGYIHFSEHKEEISEYVKNVELKKQELIGFGKRFFCFDLILGIINNFQTTQSQEAASTYFFNQFSIAKEEAVSRWEIVRYFAWAIPSIGFIGTIIGIGDALGKAHTVISLGTGTDQTGAIQSITASLGTAFDTTLIALFCSIVLMFVIHFYTRVEDKNLGEIQRIIQLNLVEVLRGDDLHKLLKNINEDSFSDLRSKMSLIMKDNFRIIFKDWIEDKDYEK